MGLIIKRTAFLGIVVLLLSAFFPASSIYAQTNERCFPIKEDGTGGTGFCISGPIRTYWERFGGLSVFGYPITPLQTETIEGSWTGPVQWFQRDRLEDHSNEGKGVLAGRIGAEYLELRGTPWVQAEPLEEGEVIPDDCRFFPETGYGTCGIIRAYWENNGGLPRFGLAITEGRHEVIEGKTFVVQYFERRRIEYHPENAYPYDILLGLLGTAVLELKNAASRASQLLPNINTSVVFVAILPRRQLFA